MKLFGRSSGYYLFWVGFVYFWVGMYFAFTQYAHSEYATLGFVLALSVPLWCPPVARYFNMEPVMFDLFNRREYPKLETPPTWKTEVPVPKEKDQEAYFVGKTVEGKVLLRIGYSTLTMNNLGVDQLIRMLEAAKDAEAVETDEAE
jgi:hypothetical protein